MDTHTATTGHGLSALQWQHDVLSVYSGEISPRGACHSLQVNGGREYHGKKPLNNCLNYFKTFSLSLFLLVRCKLRNLVGTVLSREVHVRGGKFIYI